MSYLLSSNQSLRIWELKTETMPHEKLKILQLKRWQEVSQEPLKKAHAIKRNLLGLVQAGRSTNPGAVIEAEHQIASALGVSAKIKPSFERGFLLDSLY